MTVLWGARRRDTQVGSPADRAHQDSEQFMLTHCHLERAPAAVGHTIGVALGAQLRRLARLLER